MTLVEWYVAWRVRVWRNAPRHRGAVLVPWRGRRASISIDMGATEDAAWGREARPGGTATYFAGPSYRTRRVIPAVWKPGFLAVKRTRPRFVGRSVNRATPHMLVLRV